MHLAKSDKMREFFLNANPPAYSDWVMTIKIHVLLTNVASTHNQTSFYYICYVLFSCIVKEKEQELINACLRDALSAHLNGSVGKRTTRSHFAQIYVYVVMFV